MAARLPGVDPYLEGSAYWNDFHDSFLLYGREQLQPELRKRGYRAGIGERVLVVSEAEWTIVPDLSVMRQSDPEGGVAVAEADSPVVIEVLSREERETFLEIRSDQGDLITVIELPSPTNKRGEGRQLYLQKQAEVLHSEVNLVEIDLLRQGKHTLAVHEHLVRDNRALGAWYSLICVNEAARRYSYFLYPVRLELPLPRIRVPLREGEPEIVFSLQAAAERAYAVGGYAELLDYSQPAPVPLRPEESSLLETLLARPPASAR